MRVALTFGTHASRQVPMSKKVNVALIIYRRRKSVISELRGFITQDDVERSLRTLGSRMARMLLTWWCCDSRAIVGVSQVDGSCVNSPSIWPDWL